MLLYEKSDREHSIWRWVASWWLRSGFFLFLGLVLFLSTSVFLIRSYDKYKTQNADVPQTLGEIFRMVDSLQPSPAPYEVQSTPMASDVDAEAPETTSEIQPSETNGSEEGSSSPVAAEVASLTPSDTKITLTVLEVPSVVLTLDGVEWQGDGWAALSSETAKLLKVKWTEAQTVAKDLVYRSENAKLNTAEPTFTLRFPQEWSAGSGSLGAETKATLLNAEQSEIEVIAQSAEPAATGRGRTSLRRFNIPNLKERALLVRGLLRRAAVRPEDAAGIGNDPVLRFWLSPEADQTELCLLIESR